MFRGSLWLKPHGTCAALVLVRLLLPSADEFQIAGSAGTGKPDGLSPQRQLPAAEYPYATCS
jgi:hypothetical protein